MHALTPRSRLLPLLTALALLSACAPSDAGNATRVNAASGAKPDGKKTDAKADGKTDVKADGNADWNADGNADADDFVYTSEQFADSKILRYQVPGFAELPLPQKQLVYYLYEAALWGRDIIYDQKYKHGLVIRRTLEAIYRRYKGERTDADFTYLEEYLKLVWFARGIHHDSSSQKYQVGFSERFFAEAVRACDPETLPLQPGETVDALIQKLTPIIFDPAVDPKRVNREQGIDQVKGSAVNFYEGVTQREAEAFYAAAAKGDGDAPVSHGLNSKLVKDERGVGERVWKIGGMYGPALEKIVYWLERAITVAENPAQRAALTKLVEFYKTGDLAVWDEYNIAWVKDTESRVDVVNGFIEVYNDPLGYKATFESVVSIKDLEASSRIATIASAAQWFEDHAPIEDRHKKRDVTGISAKVITVVVESGDAAPTTPIGINLPNANWIRARHGSKSVNLGNIVYAYDESRKTSGVLEEFSHSEEVVARGKLYGSLASKLKVDMHEVIGHASGVLEPGVKTPKETLKSYASALEEGRADLVALYYVLDPKLVELGLMPSLDVGKAAYDGYIRNGLMVQLARVEFGADVEESHMRNRQMVASWAYEQGKADNVIERVSEGGKTYFAIRDYDKLRALFGQLLREIQRIKSTGDFDAGEALIERYGVKVDRDLHGEVLRRYKRLGIAPYSGFIQPRLVPVTEGGAIVDVRVEYPEDFAAQQLELSEKYSPLPDYN